MSSGKGELKPESWGDVRRHKYIPLTMRRNSDEGCWNNDIGGADSGYTKSKIGAVSPGRFLLL